MKTSITKNNHLSKKIFGILVAAIFWISVWYIAAAGIGNELFLPYPHSVVKALFSLFQEGYFYKSIFVSMGTVITGFITGVFLGFVLSLISHLSEIARAIITPMITVLRATPVASFVILVYVFVRWNKLPINCVSLIIVVIMVLPIIYNNLITGYSEFDKNLSEVAQVFDFSLKKKITVLWFPQIKPYILAGTVASLGLAWKAGIAAEVICNLRNTVGKYLSDAKSNLEMDNLFAWTVTVIILSMIFEILFSRLVKKDLQKSRIG